MLADDGAQPCRRTCRRYIAQSSIASANSRLPETGDWRAGSGRRRSGSTRGPGTNGAAPAPEPVATQPPTESESGSQVCADGQCAASLSTGRSDAGPRRLSGPINLGAWLKTPSGPRSSAALEAYAALASLGEEIEDEWSYVNDLADAWRTRLDEVARRAATTAGPDGHGRGRPGDRRDRRASTTRIARSTGSRRSRRSCSSPSARRR